MVLGIQVSYCSLVESSGGGDRVPLLVGRRWGVLPCAGRAIVVGCSIVRQSVAEFGFGCERSFVAWPRALERVESFHQIIRKKVAD